MAFKGWELGTSVVIHGIQRLGIWNYMPSISLYILRRFAHCIVHHLNEVAPQFFPTTFFSNRYVIATIVMPCFFSVIGQVASVSTGIGGSHKAVVLIKEGPFGGPGEDRYFEVSFWPEGDTNLITNKHYLLRGTVVLAEVLPDKREELPKVERWDLLLLGLLC
jgi:hypothetical protein